MSGPTSPERQLSRMVRWTAKAAAVTIAGIAIKEMTSKANEIMKERRGRRQESDPGEDEDQGA